MFCFVHQEIIYCMSHHRFNCSVLIHSVQIFVDIESIATAQFQLNINKCLMQYGIMFEEGVGLKQMKL